MFPTLTCCTAFVHNASYALRLDVLRHPEVFVPLLVCAEAAENPQKVKDTGRREKAMRTVVVDVCDLGTC